MTKRRHGSPLLFPLSSPLWPAQLPWSCSWLRACGNFLLQRAGVFSVLSLARLSSLWVLCVNPPPQLLLFSGVIDQPGFGTQLGSGEPLALLEPGGLAAGRRVGHALRGQRAVQLDQCWCSRKEGTLAFVLLWHVSHDVQCPMYPYLQHSKRKKCNCCA